jgi:hypothetical protein
MRQERQGGQEKTSGFRRLADSVIHLIKQDRRPMLGPEPSDEQIRRDLGKKAEKAKEILGSDGKILSGLPPQPDNNLSNPTEPAEREWAERGPTGIYSPHKTITIHRETREAVNKMLKDEKGHKKMLAKMREIERENQKAGRVTEETLHILLP